MFSKNDDFNGDNVNQVNSAPISSRINFKQAAIQGSIGLIGGLAATLIAEKVGAAGKPASQYPIVGGDDIMKKKEHGTGGAPVQTALRWGCDVALADRICNFNRNWAESAGYWRSDTSFLTEAKPDEITTFYDSVTGKPLFRAPVGRTFDEFKAESLVHGWPSFRDSEVIWDNVRCLRDGECVSLTGTHLGHNLPDRTGNRYCINLVSVAGYPNNADQGLAQDKLPPF